MPEYIVEENGQEYIIDKSDESEGNESKSEDEVESEGNESKSESEDEVESEKSWFSSIKDDFKKGDFPKINVLNFLPPFPAAQATIALMALNKIFQHNLEKVDKYADVYTDVEIKRKGIELKKLTVIDEAIEKVTPTDVAKAVNSNVAEIVANDTNHLKNGMQGGAFTLEDCSF